MMDDVAGEHTFPQPHPWPHSPNPTEIRRSEEGRVAFRFAWRGKDFTPVDGWVVLSAPNGLMQIEHLTDEDVADWKVIEQP